MLAGTDIRHRSQPGQLTNRFKRASWSQSMRERGSKAGTPRADNREVGTGACILAPVTAGVAMIVWAGMRYAPPVHMIKLNETREITPYVCVHLDEEP